MTVRSSTVNQEYVTPVSSNNPNYSDESFEITQESSVVEFSFESFLNMSFDELENSYSTATVPTLHEAQSLKSMTNYSDDEAFNAILFKQASVSLEQTGELTTFSRNFTLPMMLISEGGFIELKDITLPEAASKYGIKNSEALDEIVEKHNASSQNTTPQKVDDVIATMKKLPELYKEKESSLTMDVAGMFQNFMQILSEHQSLQNQSKVALNSYTKTNSPNSLI